MYSGLDIFSLVFFLVMPIFTMIVPIYGIWLLAQIISLYRSRNEPHETTGKDMMRYINVAKQQYTRGEITEEELEAIKQAVV